MAYNNQEKDNRPKAPFDLFALTLWAPSTAPGKSAMFLVDVDVGFRVTLTVRTGDPADKEKGKDGDVIRMKMELRDFEKVVNLFGDVIRSKGEMKVAAVEQVYFRWNKEQGKRERIEQPRDGNQLFFVKDSEGKIALSLVQYNRPKIEFSFLSTKPALVFKHGDGSPYSDAEMSQSEARAYHKILSELFSRVSASQIRQHQIPDQYKPPYVPQQAAGNGGGGYNKGNNNGGGQQQRPANSGGNEGSSKAAVTAFDDMDDDIPY